MKVRLISTLMISTWVAAGLVWTVAGAEQLAVTGATLIDGTGKEPVRDAVLLISDGRIAKIGGVHDVAIPRGTKKLDARGKYLIPGLMDANVHLALPDLETTVKYEDRLHELALEAAQITLKAGQTTVFDTYGPRAALIKARDMINAGQAPGSRIYLAGSIVGMTGPLGADMRDPQVLGFVSKSFAERFDASYEEGIGPELLLLTPEEVRPFIRGYAHKGIDFMKYAASGHGFWPEIATFNYITFSPRVQRVIVEEAHRAGLTIQAHITTSESLDMALDAGVDIITHGDISGPTAPFPQEMIQKLVERRVPASVILTTQKYLDNELQQLAKSPPKVGFAFPQFQKVSRVNQRNMIQAGAILLVSTDSTMANAVQLAQSGRTIVDSRNIGEGHFNALVGLEELGMAPMEILKSATSHIAKAYKVDANLGTLEAGKVADLVILDRNPLESARNYRSIYAVVKDGKVVDREALPLVPIMSATTVADVGGEEGAAAKH